VLGGDGTCRDECESNYKSNEGICVLKCEYADPSNSSYFPCGEECVLGSDGLCKNECEYGYTDNNKVGICGVNCEVLKEDKSCPKVSESAQENLFPWWILIIVGVVLVGLTGVGIGYFVYYRKKKAQEKEEEANVEELMNEDKDRVDAGLGSKTKKWKKKKDKMAKLPMNSSIGSSLSVTTMGETRMSEKSNRSSLSNRSRKSTGSRATHRSLDTKESLRSRKSKKSTKQRNRKSRTSRK
jgi:hypothetical protein